MAGFVEKLNVSTDLTDNATIAAAKKTDI